jgi:LysR family transcriptional regulator, hca operon transcriptional activator
VTLLARSVRGVEPTEAGRAFLEHARSALAQVDAAVEAARRTVRPAKPSLALGFLTGQEMDWLPASMNILRDELPNIDVTVSGDISPNFADSLRRRRLDLAFLRPEPNLPELEYRLLLEEPLVIVLPRNHRLASREAIAIGEIAGEIFIGISRTAPSLQAVIENYLQRFRLDIRAAHEVDNLGMAMSLVASTRGVALLPAYAQNFLPAAVTSRPLRGDPPRIALVIGYKRANSAPTLKLFLSRIDRLMSRVAEKSHPVAKA